MLKSIALKLVSRAENRIGVKLDYARQIARTNFGLMTRYGKIFGFLDPNRNVPPLAYHAARLRGAISADCGTCVQAEINLARQADISPENINLILAADYSKFPAEIKAVALLADAVVGRSEDETCARETVLQAFGDAGLIEVSFAMNGAALLPGIKRAMGYATTCDLDILRLTR